MFTTKAPDEVKSKTRKAEVAQPAQTEPTVQSSAKAPIQSNKTLLYVRYNTGFSNALFIRGQGANLSWTKGIPLKNIQADLWLFETDTPFTQAEFKILLNDQQYEDGANRTIRCGSQIEFSPHFKH